MTFSAASMRDVKPPVTPFVLIRLDILPRFPLANSTNDRVVIRHGLPVWLLSGVCESAILSVVSLQRACISQQCFSHKLKLFSRLFPSKRAGYLWTWPEIRLRRDETGLFIFWVARGCSAGPPAYAVSVTFCCCHRSCHSGRSPPPVQTPPS